MEFGLPQVTVMIAGNGSAGWRALPTKLKHVRLVGARLQRPAPSGAGPFIFAGGYSSGSSSAAFVFFW